MLNGPAHIARHDDGSIKSINQGEGQLTSMFHIEVDRLSSKEEMTELKTNCWISCMTLLWL